MNTALIENTDSAECAYCHRELPVECFRFRNRKAGIRHTECRECHRRYALERRAIKREKELRRFGYRVYAARAHADRIGRLAAEMMKQFGGPQGFARIWVQVLRKAREEGRNGVFLRSFTAVLLIGHAAEVLRRQASEAETEQMRRLSDEDLQNAQLAAAVEVVASEPAASAKELGRLGWRLSPINSERS
jgi:hypothetical protein